MPFKIERYPVEVVSALPYRARWDLNAAGDAAVAHTQRNAHHDESVDEWIEATVAVDVGRAVRMKKWSTLVFRGTLVN
jgi:hypothetical protein